MERSEHQVVLLQAKADALFARVLLDELRAGRMATALELLEQQLDVSILVIDGFVRKAEPAPQAQAVGTLRVVREYRRRHPRKTEAAIEESEDSQSKHQIRDKVKKILDEIPDA